MSKTRSCRSGGGEYLFWRSLEGSTTNLDRRDSAWLNALGCGKAPLITWCVQVSMVCDDLCRTVLSLRSRGPGKGPLLHVPCVVASYPSSSWGPWRQLFLAGSGTHQSAPWGPGSVFLARWRRHLQATHQSPTGIENSTTPVVRDSDIFRGLSLRLWSQLFCCPFNLRWLLLTFRSPSCVLRSWSRVVLLLLFRVALVDHSLT